MLPRPRSGPDRHRVEADARRGPQPIINYQYPGYVLGDVAAKIEAARYFCWKGAHYLDEHDFHGEMHKAMEGIDTVPGPRS